MNKERPSQLELFSREQDSQRLVVKPLDSSLVDYIKLYEKSILLIIGFVITGIIAFCFGVEKGKDISVSSSGVRFDVAGQKLQDKAPAVFTKKEISKLTVQENQDRGESFYLKGQLKDMPVKQEIILQQQPQQGNNAYTIQIASYQGRESAEKEMAKLRKTGLAPLVIKKSGYNVVCVGTFNNKETARSLLTQLKSKYRDCYIRRL
jgi:hypothetical protein